LRCCFAASTTRSKPSCSAERSSTTWLKSRKDSAHSRKHSTKRSVDRALHVSLCSEACSELLPLSVCIVHLQTFSSVLHFQSTVLSYKSLSVPSRSDCLCTYNNSQVEVDGNSDGSRQSQWIPEEMGICKPFSLEWS